jgi:hypothetical protein
MSSDRQHGPSSGMGRRELLAIAGIAALYAKPAEACVFFPEPEGLKEIVQAYLDALNDRQFERLAPLLSDGFRFYPRLTEPAWDTEWSLDTSAYIASLQDGLISKRGGIRSRIVDVSLDTLIQIEFVEFEDRPTIETSCGKGFNWQKRLAIYKMRVRQPPPPVISLTPAPRPVQKTEPQKPLPPFAGTEITSIWHLYLAP